MRLDKQSAIERDRDISFPTNHRLLRELYEPTYFNEGVDAWEAMQVAADEGFITLKGPKKPDPNLPAWDCTRVIFNIDNEEILREWFSMPRSVKSARYPAELVGRYREIDFEFIERNPLTIKELSDADVVERLAKVFAHLKQERATLRQLAACYFHGASKALDAKGEEWLEAALMLPPGTVLPRPIHILCSVSTDAPKALLFIENKDTFDMLSRTADFRDRFAIVYLSGFMGTASRLRTNEGATLFFSDSSTETGMQWVNGVWLDDSEVPAYFWGDLDYAGLQIGVSLRKIFPSLDWYTPAYNEMIRLLNEGVGHPFSGAGKDGQTPVPEDHLWGIGKQAIVVVEALERFLDQEAVLNLEQIGAA